MTTTSTPTRRTRAPREALPKIIRFDGRSDSGEYGNATCPHCGADGRYVYRFLCDDGRRRGAMAGCIKLFPVSPVAQVHETLLKKEADYAKKDWKLPSWDLRKLEAIQAFYDGTGDERACLDAIRDQVNAASAYRARKGRKW